MSPFFPEGMPLPAVEPDTAGWWAAVREHRLVIQRCHHCGTFRHPPVPVCYICQSFDFRWAPVSGRGLIYSYTEAVHPVHPALKTHGPYNIVVVELPDAGNVRLVGNLLDTPYEAIRIGLPVEAVFEDIPPDVTLVQWRPSS